MNPIDASRVKHCGKRMRQPDFKHQEGSRITKVKHHLPLSWEAVLRSVSILKGWRLPLPVSTSERWHLLPLSCTSQPQPCMLSLVRKTHYAIAKLLLYAVLRKTRPSAKGIATEHFLFFAVGRPLGDDHTEGRTHKCTKCLRKTMVCGHAQHKSDNSQNSRDRNFLAVEKRQRANHIRLYQRSVIPQPRVKDTAPQTSFKSRNHRVRGEAATTHDDLTRYTQKLQTQHSHDPPCPARLCSCCNASPRHGLYR